jgi:Protein of unknown function (DUF3105)
MAKRRTSGIQRRERASDEAMTRRLDESPAAGLPDWRLLAIGGLLLVGVVLVVLVLVFSSGPNANAGTAQPDDGSSHVTDGASCRDNPESCGLTASPYSSTPGTSGPHWNNPTNWGAYTTPQNESQLIHNLEHGGIVIWYDPAALDESGVTELSEYVRTQVAAGISGRYKFILSPWASGDELGAPIAVTAWRNLLELEELDLGAIDAFASEHYGMSPEPNGGPGPPAG